MGGSREDTGDAGSFGLLWLYHAEAPDSGEAGLAGAWVARLRHGRREAVLIWRTSHRAGGLRLTLPVKAASVAVPDAFAAPAYIDSRSYCLPANNQGPTSMCAGYATAGWLEVHNWRMSNCPKEYDAEALYRKAKEIEGVQDPGTTLEAVAGAVPVVTQLVLKPRYIDAAKSVKYALHRHAVAVVGLRIDDNWNRCSTSTGWIGIDRGVAKLGGHAVLACWYDSVGVGVQNSWGADWGVRGFGRMTWAQFEEQFISGFVLE